MPHYTIPGGSKYSSSSSSSSSIPPSQIQPQRHYTHRRDDSGYRSRYEFDENDVHIDESFEASEGAYRRSTYGEQSIERPHNINSNTRYYTDSSESGSPEEHSSRYSSIPQRRSEGRYSGSSYDIPAGRQRVMPAPRITISEYDYNDTEGGYTFYPQAPRQQPYSQTDARPHPRYESLYYPDREEVNSAQSSSAGRGPYSNRTYQRHHHSPSSSSQDLYNRRMSTNTSSPLRHAPSMSSNYSNYSRRDSESRYYSTSPPSPDRLEQSTRVNGYGRVPLWYEERQAFTRYT